ncbi:hypothetical protein D1646_06485 [Pseudoflavonifractor sp. 60]|uniref:hypothetical protein n=1 Tax=Pseudoflavonifractor sp. 60 TaxID=2304576 RepID=UPI00136AC459|nr:hypothetical protein [Pseudoflavonifractor sp. 60]NBI66466.1 hypothetical protein [Pseudoflavonifractor sp. 60]
MRPKSTDQEKRAAVRSVVLSTLLQLMAVGVLLYLRSVTQTGWLRGLLLLLAVTDLITIPFTFAALGQRVREIEKGELNEARKY